MTAAATQISRDYPGCLANLNNIKERWINAKAACLAHEATVARNDRYRQWNNWVTLVLAVLTALSATLLPILGDENPVILGLTIAMAILTSLSKGVEQTFARPEDTPIHQTAVANLRGTMDELGVVSGTIFSYVLRRSDVNLEATHTDVQVLGAAIEDTRRDLKAPESDDHRRRAVADFDKTPIRAALDTTANILQNLIQVRLSHLEVDAVLEENVNSIR